jgi:hypothetical protein
VLGSLARIWRETQDIQIPCKIGEWCKLSLEESEALLGKLAGNGGEKGD